MCGCIAVLGQVVVCLANFVVMALGLLTTGVGVLMKYAGDSIQELQSNFDLDLSSLTTIIIAFIVAGIAIFVLGMTGCIGATCKVIWCLILNASAFVILAAGTIYLLIIIIQFLADSKLFINDTLTNIFNNNATQNGTFHGIEVLLECCGVNGTDSYVDAGMPIPPTCCTNNTEVIDSLLPPGTDISCHSIGCATVLTNYIEKYGTIVRSVLIAIVCVEIATIGFDIVIACSKKKNKTS